MTTYEADLAQAHVERRKRLMSVISPETDPNELPITPKDIKPVDSEPPSWAIQFVRMQQRLDVIERRLNQLTLEVSDEAPLFEPGRGRRIVREVAAAHGVKFADMSSAKRHTKIAHARQEAYYLLSTKTPLSTTQIGRILNRDHTTVMHGVRAYAKRNNIEL